MRSHPLSPRQLFQGHLMRVLLLLLLTCVASLSATILHAAPAAPSITEYALPTGAGPQDITTGPDGNLWVTENLANKIARITPAGGVTEFTLPTPNSNIIEIVAGPDQALWFTALFAKNIGRITTAGVVTEFPITGTSGGPSSIINGPGGLWFTLPDDNSIGRITTAGVVSTFVLTTTNVSVRDIVVGPDGAIWASETSFATDAIARVDPTTGQVTEYPLPSNFGGTSQLTVAGGQIYFAVTQSNVIGRLDPATGAVTSYQIPTADALPSGITAKDGIIYFTEAADGAPGLGRLDPASGQVVEWTVPSANANVQALTIGPDENLWYAGFASNKVGKVNIKLSYIYLPLVRR